MSLTSQYLAFEMTLWVSFSELALWVHSCEWAELNWAHGVHRGGISGCWLVEQHVVVWAALLAQSSDMAVTWCKSNITTSDWFDRLYNCVRNTHKSCLQLWLGPHWVVETPKTIHTNPHSNAASAFVIKEVWQTEWPMQYNTSVICHQP